MPLIDSLKKEGKPPPEKPRVALKYCGSCNPYIDFAAIKKWLAGLQAELGFELVPFSAAGADAIIILCGCQRACANRQDVRASAPKSLLIAGCSIDGKAVDESRLLAGLKDRLSDMLSTLP